MFQDLQGAVGGGDVTADYTVDVTEDSADDTTSDADDDDDTGNDGESIAAAIDGLLVRYIVIGVSILYWVYVF